MKILILNHGLHISGVSRALVNLANALCQNGHDVTVKIEINDFTLASELDPRVKCSLFLKEIRPFGKRIRGFLRYYPVWRRRLFALSAEKQYKKVVREKYDVEIAFNRGAGAKIISGSDSKAKKLVWVHSDYLLCGNGFAGFESGNEAIQAYKKFDKIVCVSEQSRKAFEELFGINGKTCVAYNLYDTDKIRASSAEKAFDKKRFTVCAVGRLHSAKNYPMLLRVCKILKDRGVDLDCYIVGGGPEEQELLKMKESLGLDNVYFTLAQSNPYKYIAQSDLYVCTSVYEGLSSTTIESLILGKGCLVTDCTGMSEILTDESGEQYGVICHIDDEAFANELQYLYEHPEALQALEKKARQRAKRFEKDSLYKKTEELF